MAEQRLIDANALPRSIVIFRRRSFLDGRRYISENREVVFAAEIDRAPTIDAAPVVHAFWRHIGGDEWCCTDCALVISTEGSWEKPWQAFCPNCGAKMDGGAEK